MHLKPIGRPIAAVPLKGSPSSVGYGPPKPVPFPPHSYGGPPGSGYGGPVYPPSRPFISGGKPPIGPLYGGSRPSAVYEPIDNIDKKQVVVPSQHGGVQQHVHHHYHHTDAEKLGVIDAPTPIYPSATGGSYAGEVNSLYQNSNGFVGSNYGGGLESYGSGSTFYKKELNLKGSASSK